jgi:hypothetical protein
VREREDLCAVLVIAARLPSLDADALAMGPGGAAFAHGILEQRTPKLNS